MGHLGGIAFGSAGGLQRTNSNATPEPSSKAARKGRKNPPEAIARAEQQEGTWWPLRVVCVWKIANEKAAKVGTR